EVRKRLDERRKGEDPIGPRAAAPGDQRSNHAATKKRQRGPDAEEDKGPGKVRDDEAGDRRVFRPRVTEVAMGQVSEVLRVLVPQARVDVVAELQLDREYALLVAVARLGCSRDSAGDRVAGVHARYQ